jgi:hypothetical protein
MSDDVKCIELWGCATKKMVSKFINFFQPHGPVMLRSRGRGAGSRTSQEEGESKHSAAIEHHHHQQQQSSCQQQDDDELPLARVRDDALARKVCASFAYSYLVNIFVHFGHQLCTILETQNSTT